MSIQRLSYLGFEVADIAAWRAFAADKLGVMESSATSHRARFRIDSRAWRLNVDKGPADDLSFSGYEVDSEEALTAVKKRLEAHGVAVSVEGPDMVADRGVLASLIHDARFRARSGHLLRLAVLRGRPASLAFVSPHSD